MDWFERLTGFREDNCDDTRRRLRVEGDRLRSLVNHKSYRIGTLGGGAFGNDQRWIHDAMRRALEIVSGAALDVRIVSRGPPNAALQQVAQDFG